MAEEVELKYALADHAAYTRWTEVSEMAPFYVVMPDAVPTLTVVDTYLDTPDRRFLRHGMAVRRRSIGTRTLLSIKSLAAAPETSQTGTLHRRREVEASLNTPEEAATPETWPPAVRDAVTHLLAQKTILRPCAIIQQTRAKRIVQHGPPLQATTDTPADDAATDGLPPFRAELSVDSVEIVSPLDQGVARRRHELEVELLQGSEDELTEIAGQLSADPDLSGQTRSKFEDALQTLACYPPSRAAETESPLGLTGEMPMSEAARMILHQQFVDMLLNEPGVRYGDDMEFVHDMRVATRRARVVLDVFGPYLKPKKKAFLNRRLRTTGRLLGAVRDLDVALHNAEAAVGDESTEQKAVLKRWRKKRKSAFKALIAWFDGDKYGKFVERFDEFVNTPGLGAYTPRHVLGKRPPAVQVRHVMPVLLTEQFAAVRSYETLFENGAAVDYATIHRLRIDAKYLRYELEFVRDLLGHDGEIMIRQLRKFQDHLGALNDAVVAMSMLTPSSGKKHGVTNDGITNDGITNDADPSDVDLSDVDPSTAKMLMYQRELVHKLTAETPTKLARFCSRKNRRRLGRAVAEL